MTPTLPIGRLSVTIGAGASLSAGTSLEGVILCGIITASTWDTAAISFQVSHDGVTYYDLWSGAAELSYAAVTASKWITWDPALFYAIPYVKIRSGVSGTAVNQVDATILTLITRRL